MEQKTLLEEGGKFSSLEEEVKYLRERVKEKEAHLELKNESLPREEVIRGEVKEYQKKSPEEVLHPSKQILSSRAEAIVLVLSPKTTDEKIEELLGVMQEKGLLNALKILEQIGDSEVEDDFHRFLVQFIKKGMPLESGGAKSSLLKALHATLFEVEIPSRGPEEKEKPIKEILFAMEQFLSGVVPRKENSSENPWVSLEIAVSNDRRDIVFYVAVPDSLRDSFEKQFLAVFPRGRLKEQKNDYNIFRHDSSVGVSTASLEKSIALPLRRYQDFEFDPLQTVLNAFSKIAETGEGAGLQIILRHPSSDYGEKYRKAIKDIEKGIPTKEALNIPENFGGEFSKSAGKALRELIVGGQKKKEEGVLLKEGERAIIEEIKKKMESETLLSNIRLVSAAGDASRQESILHDLESSFHQFSSPSGNSLKFQRVSGRAIFEEVKSFSFRMFAENESLPLSLRELAGVFHFSSQGSDSVSELKKVSSVSAPAPLQVASEGIVLGVNKYRGENQKILFGKEDRLRHFYLIGQTGTGKTTLLKNMIIQDIKNGEGVCMIDPHGNDIDDVLGAIPPERYDDVIYFDPAYTARPMGLNMMEFDPAFPEQKTFVVNELLSIFRKLFGAVPESMGPAFEQYFRNSAMLVMEDPSSGNTLIEVGRVLSDKKFRLEKLAKCQNPIIKQFWENAEKTTGDQGLANYAQYVTNKFDTFVTNDVMRPVIAQNTSAFHFREIMDQKKILLVNLSKGRLGEINSHLIGLVLVGKILMAALSRADSFGKDFSPFYLYIDEFQNVTTDSISQILSEARKYKLSLSVAHQFIKQLDEKIRDAVFGNVGSLCSFRVGAEDAEFLERQFSPIFSAKDLQGIENHNAVAKLLVNGSPEKAFSLETLAPEKGNPDKVMKLKEISYLTYGKDRGEVEAEIQSRFK